MASRIIESGGLEGEDVGAMLEVEVEVDVDSVEKTKLLATTLLGFPMCFQTSLLLTCIRYGAVAFFI
jgi:hypothetical protein